MTKYIIILFLISIFQISCNTTDYKIRKVKETFENGNLRIVKFYKSDGDTISCFLKEYYENGQLKREGLIKDSIVHGYWKYYYENGNLMQTGEYIIDDSINNGNWTYSYKQPLKDENGNILKEHDGWMCSYEWREREKHNLHVCKDGYWEFFHENGKLKSKGKFINGWFDSLWVEYSDNGQKILEAKYLDKTQKGEWKFWYPNGQLKKIIKHTDSLTLMLEAYDVNGVQKVKDGDGQFIEHTPLDTAEKFLATYENGVLNGKYVKYFENGKVEREGQYLNGEEEGTWTSYYFYYGKWLIRNYKNGKAHGYFYNFYINEDTTLISFFVNGFEDGITKHFDEHTGEITLIEPWEMGERHGIRKYFDSSGIPELYQYFYKGEMVGEERFENGEIVKQRIFEGDEKKFYSLK